MSFESIFPNLKKERENVKTTKMLAAYYHQNNYFLAF